MKAKIIFQVRGNSPTPVKDDTWAIFESYFGDIKEMKSDNYYSSSAVFGRTVSLPVDSGLELIKFIEKLVDDLFTPNVMSVVLEVTIKDGMDLYPATKGVKTSVRATRSLSYDFSYSLVSEVETTTYTENVVKNILLDPFSITRVGKVLLATSLGISTDTLESDIDNFRTAISKVVWAVEPCNTKVVASGNSTLIQVLPVNSAFSVGFLIFARAIFGDGVFIPDFTLPTATSMNIEGTTVFIRHKV